LNASSDDWQRALAAHHRAISLHFRGALTEEELRQAEQLSELVGSALGRRNLCALRGWWLSDAEEWKLARDSLSEAVVLAHKVGKIDRRSEIRLALARYHLGEDVQVQEISDQLSNAADILTHLPLALLWLAAGNTSEAENYAVTAYKHAWADGAPYSHWYECARARAILEQIGENVPALPPFSAAQSHILAWEPHAARAIEAERVSHQRQRRYEEGATKLTKINSKET
jgi:hypothetical protein